MTALGHDLRVIRERRKRSIADIHWETRIPMRILESIEDGSIFENADVPETYVRSYVRTIGKALQIPDRKLIHALNAQKAGAYDSHLLKESPPEQTPATPQGALFDGDDPESYSFSSHSQAERPGPPSMQSVDWASKLKYKPGIRLSPWILWVSGILVVILVASGFVWGLRILSGPGEGSLAEEAAPVDNTSAAASDAPSIGSETEPVEVAAEDSAFDERSMIPEAGNPAFDGGGIPTPSEEPPSSDSPPASAAQSADVPTPAATQSAQTAPAAANPNRAARTAPPQPPAVEPVTIFIHASGTSLNGLQLSSDLLEGTRSLNLEEGQAVRFQAGESLELAGPTGRLTLYVNGRIVQGLNTLYFDRTSRKVILSRSDLETLAGDAPGIDTLPVTIPPDSIITLP